MPTLNLQVASGDDDAHEQDNNFGFDRTNVSLVANSNVNGALRYNVGFRFQNVTVPQGATVTAAVLQVRSNTTVADDVNCDIVGQAHDNAPSFVTDADVTSRARTAAAVAWVQDGIGTNFASSPDIATVIQEVVNRAGWASGNALVVFLDGKSNTSKTLNMHSYESAPANAAKLDITYAAPGAPSPVAMRTTGGGGEDSCEIPAAIDIGRHPHRAVPR